MSLVVRARSTRSSTTRPPLIIALSPSSLTMRARKRSKTSSWRLRAKSTPLTDVERSRFSRACLNAAARRSGSRGPTSGANRLQVVLVNERAGERLSNGHLDELGGHMRVNAVQERPSRVRHRDGANLDAILPRHIAVMNDYPLRHAEATLAPAHGQRQVHLSRERV